MFVARCVCGVRCCLFVVVFLLLRMGYIVLVVVHELLLCVFCVWLVVGKAVRGCGLVVVFVGFVWCVVWRVLFVFVGGLQSFVACCVYFVIDGLPLYCVFVVCCLLFGVCVASSSLCSLCC